jgi:hypothetical protein
MLRILVDRISEFVTPESKPNMPPSPGTPLILEEGSAPFVVRDGSVSSPGISIPGEHPEVPLELRTTPALSPKGTSVTWSGLRIKGQDLPRRPGLKTPSHTPEIPMGLSACWRQIRNPLVSRWQKKWLDFGAAIVRYRPTSEETGNSFPATETRRFENRSSRRGLPMA